MTADCRISAVYGPHRTFLSRSVGVDHHNRYREREYVVNRQNHKLLAPLVLKGQQQIAQWMTQQPTLSAEEVTSFEANVQKERRRKKVRFQFF